MLSPAIAPRLQGIQRADSLAFDFHKWGQVPYDAGFVMLRDGVLHRQAFATSAPYLRREGQGLAAGSPWPCDFGPDLSRGFRALKTWFTFKVYGAGALGASIAHTCELARYLETRVRETEELELAAPVDLAAGAGPGVTDVESLGALESLAGGGFDLDAEEAAAGLDDYVVAGGVSPGAEDAVALF